MYALADCNNFFVSCERVFRPDLRNKPVIVLSGNDGCVISRSNEAKKLGVKMGAAFFKIREDVAKNDIQCFSSNFSLYGDLSSRVMSILSTHTHWLEQYSIDEAFLDLSYLRQDELKPTCEVIVKEVLRGVGIPISMGIAPTKTLAKVASKYAKQYPGYHGACIIDTEDKRRMALQDFPIGDVWGLGRKSCAKLEKMGICTALDFALCGRTFARNLLQKPGENTWLELNGIDAIEVSELPEKQSIMQSRTFKDGVYERTTLEKYLADFTASSARKLRAQHSVCTHVSYFVETSRFRTDERQKQIFQTIQLPVGTNLTAELQEAVLRSFRDAWRPGYPFKRAGVILTGIFSSDNIQQNLFDNRDRARDERLQRVIDGVVAQYGKSALVAATQLATDDSLRMLQAGFMSPCYSTNIHDIFTVRC